MPPRFALVLPLLALAVLGIAHDVGVGPVLSIRVGGCLDFLRGVVCELPSEGRRVLRVRAETAPGVEVSLLVDRRPAESVRSNSGLFELEVPPSASAIDVVARSRWSTSRARVRIGNAIPTPELDEANRLRGRGQFAQALALIDAVPATAAPRVVARAAGLKARIRRVWPAKDVSATAAMFRDAIAKDQAAGRALGELSDRIALTYTLFNESRYAEVREELARLQGANRIPEDFDDTFYHRGLLELATGNFDGALRDFREAIRRSDAMARPVLKQQVLVPLIELLHYLGRRSEALEHVRYLEKATSAADPACRRAEASHNIGWFVLDGSPPDAPVDPRAQAALELAATLYRTDCRDAAGSSQARVALTFLALRAGDLAAARRYLDESRKDAPPEPPPRLSRRWVELEGRIALAAEQWSAAAETFRRLTLMGGASASAMDEWTGEVGRGQALEGAGDLDAAAGAYASAEEALDRAQAGVPIGQGRSTFTEQRQRSASLLVDLLVRQSKPKDAMQVGRKSRARALRSLRSTAALDQGLSEAARRQWDDALQAYQAARNSIDQESKDDWRLSNDELSQVLERRKDRIGTMNGALYAARSRLIAPTYTADLPATQPGEVTILLHPAKVGWLGIGMLDGQVVTARLQSLTDGSARDSVASASLRPFLELVRNASSLRLLPYGPAESLDFQKAAQALGLTPRHSVVRYGLDVDSKPMAAGGTRAVVVADPRSDLPSARLEAATVAASLTARGWRVTVLDRSSAVLDSVKAALEDPAVGWFHYGGHGVYAGTDGQDSELPLADGQSLRAGDILSLARVPPQIVLAGCNTAGADGGPVMLSIAHAFVLAGAHAVLGSHTRVADEAARHLVSRLYEDKGESGGSELALAAIGIAQSAPELRFRLLVP